MTLNLPNRPLFPGHDLEDDRRFFENRFESLFRIHIYGADALRDPKPDPVSGRIRMPPNLVVGISGRVAPTPVAGAPKWFLACHAVSDATLAKYLHALVNRVSDPMSHIGLEDMFAWHLLANDAASGDPVADYMLRHLVFPLGWNGLSGARAFL